MTPRFDETKATQLAGLLLKMRGTGRMHFLKLIKLMYLIDREALLTMGMVNDRRSVRLDGARASLKRYL